MTADLAADVPESAPESEDPSSSSQVETEQTPLTSSPAKSAQTLTTSSPGNGDRPSISPGESGVDSTLDKNDRPDSEEKDDLSALAQVQSEVISPPLTSLDEKEPSTASPGKSVVIPADFVVGTKEPSSPQPSPGKSAVFPADSTAETKKSEGSPPGSPEGRSPDSVLDKRSRSDYEGIAAALIDLDAENNPASGVCGGEALSPGSSPEMIQRSAYKGKAVVVSDEVMEPAVPHAGIPNVFQSDTWQYYHLYGEDESLTIKDSTKQPVVGDKESLSALAAECETGSSLIKANIKLLGDQYSALRRTRRDGNCFCRAFLVAYLEYIWESKDVSEVTRVKSSVNQCITALKNGGYHPYVFESNFDVFFENLDFMTDQRSISTGEELLVNLRDEQTSDILVKSLRLAIAADILNRTDFFREFGLLDDGIEDIVETVLTMEREVEDMHVSSLCNALGVPFRVIYLDRHPFKAGSAVNQEVYLPSLISGSAGGSEDKPDDVQPLFTLLFRPPGHYDILYS